MNAGVTSLRVRELAARLGGVLRCGDGEIVIHGVSGIGDAMPGDVTFVSSAKYAAQWPQSKAGAVVVSAHAVGALPSDHRPVVTVENAELATITLLQMFAPPVEQPNVGVHSAAVVDPSAALGDNVRIGAHVFVGPHSVIGDNVVLHAGVVIYGETRIGDESVVHSGVVVRERCRLGRRVVLHQNVSIGADGFGYRPSPDHPGSFLKVPHIGNVVIEDEVEIGAGSCIDRAKFGSTLIGRGTKIDNLVHIAHNCRIGRNCLIMAQAGLAGSIEVGDEVMIGGHVAIADHLKIGSKARIGPKSGVMHDIPAGASFLGVPAGPDKETLRQWAAIRKLPALFRGRTGRDPAPGGHMEPVDAAD